MPFHMGYTYDLSLHEVDGWLQDGPGLYVTWRCWTDGCNESAGGDDHSVAFRPNQSGLLPKHTHELLAVGSCHATNTQPEEMTSTQDVTIMWTSNRSKQGWPNAKYGMRSLLCHQKARANEPAAQPTHKTRPPYARNTAQPNKEQSQIISKQSSENDAGILCNPRE